MPGQKPKAQHFVQRAYLEGFQDPELEKNGEEFLWLYMPRKSPFRQRPDRVAKRNYYYCYNDEAARKRVQIPLLQNEASRYTLIVHSKSSLRQPKRCRKVRKRNQEIPQSYH